MAMQGTGGGEVKMNVEKCQQLESLWKPRRVGMRGDPLACPHGSLGPHSLNNGALCLLWFAGHYLAIADTVPRW